MVKDKKLTGRTIQVEENDSNSVILRRSFIGEVKAMCFLTKLLVLCQEHGLRNIEVKLGGLEVMVVMENESMTANVLNDKEHGLRRWMYNLRRGTLYIEHQVE
ncbi:hypothetical protein Tco_1280514, partial [Tanacetum coccineum]